jgi:hypothetical protein
MTSSQAAASRLVIAALVVGAACSFGCGGGSSDGTGGSLGASFTESATPAAPRLVKLVQKSKSGTHVVVDAVIYGPDVTLDMYTFAFDVKIADPTVVKFVAGSAVAGNALVAFAGQSLEAIADLGTAPGGGADNSRVVVGVSKLGGGVGNGIAGASSVVVELTFAVQKAGTTTLTLTGSPIPQVLDSNGLPIASITFDSAGATMSGT